MHGLLLMADGPVSSRTRSKVGLIAKLVAGLVVKLIYQCRATVQIIVHEDLTRIEDTIPSREATTYDSMTEESFTQRRATTRRRRMFSQARMELLICHEIYMTLLQCPCTSIKEYTIGNEDNFLTGLTFKQRV